MGDRWAAAAPAPGALDGDKAGLDKLRQACGKANAFRLLADDGSTTGDPRRIASQMAQVGELQSVMAS